MRWLLVVSVACVAAADLPDGGIGPLVEAGAGRFAVALDSANGSFSADAGLRLVGFGLGGRWTLGEPGLDRGWLVGTEAMAMSGQGAGATLATQEARLVIGWCRMLGDALCVSVEGRGGGGRSRYEVADAAGSAFAAEGWLWLADLGGGAAWSLDERWRVLAGVGWRHEQHDLSGDGVAVQAISDVLVLRFGLEWRPWAVPRGLE
jgi:hypothetical protein